MKAIVHTQFGRPDVLHIQEVEKPVPNKDQILVRVRALSLNPAESHMMGGNLMARVLGGNGLLKPKNIILGADFAGTVEAVGSDITHFKVGDEVFGRRAPGGFAEYVCVSERPIALKPKNISFEQAAAIPVAAMTALQSLRDAGKIQSGQKVLINGASGGVGTFTVQIAKAFGAHVTAVCSTRNVDLVRSLGADRVIDYTREDFTKSAELYDLIIDNVGNRSAKDRARILKPHGICVGIGFTSFLLLIQNFITEPFVARSGNKKFVGMLAKINRDDLTFMKELIEAGKVTPVVDKIYSPTEVPEAYRYLQSKHASAKIVVTF